MCENSLYDHVFSHAHTHTKASSDHGQSMVTANMHLSIGVQFNNIAMCWHICKVTEHGHVFTHVHMFTWIQLPKHGHMLAHRYVLNLYVQILSSVLCQNICLCSHAQVPNTVTCWHICSCSHKCKLWMQLLISLNMHIHTHAVMNKVTVCCFQAWSCVSMYAHIHTHLVCKKTNTCWHLCTFSHI